MLAARLDQLPGPERAALERGAVEGQVFHRSAVQALAPEDPQVASRLLGLVRKELVRPEQAQLPDDDAFRFRHILIRDAAYDALPKATRAELHERFAAWLEQRGAALVELDEILGYHLARACGYLHELGLDAERARELAERASERLAAGGRAALARDDARGAARLLARSVELLDGCNPRRAPVLVDLAEARFEADDLRESRDAAEEALEAAREVGDEHLQARARVPWLWTSLQIDATASSEEALAETETLLSVLTRAGDGDGLAKTWALRALLLFYLGRSAEALDAGERAAEEARRAGNLRIEAQALQGGVAARTHGATPAAEAIVFTDHALKRAADPTTRSFVCQKRARLEAMRGDFEAARAFYGECKELALEYGLRVRRGVQTQDGAAIELAAGDPVAAEQELREGYEVLAEIGETGFRSTVAAYLADALFAQGRLDEAARAADDAIELAQADDFDPICRARAAKARIVAARGDFETAKALARSAVALEEQTDYIQRHADTLVALARVCEAAGDPAEAAEAARESLALYARKGDVVGAARVRTLLEDLDVSAAEGIT